VKGTLYIVSTPIGNLEDITLRALRILKEADIIASEDTRHSLKLLNYYGISRPLISYWREREKTKADEIVTMLNSGKNVALISDAGTPGISDPGTLLIRRAIEENVPVVSVPGPSAVIAALSLSGLRTDTFTFAGFLPAKKAQRQKTLHDLSLELRTLIMYEAPHRVMETLKDMEVLFIGRRAAIVREITKLYEEVLRGTVSEIRAAMQNTKIAGEYVIIVEGRPVERKLLPEDVLAEIRLLMKKGLGRKEAVSKIADAYSMSKKELYAKSLNEFP
jgi:16S rRNA (cytidine1402-2'-O)-methyltransferase